MQCHTAIFAVFSDIKRRRSHPGEPPPHPHTLYAISPGGLAGTLMSFPNVYACHPRSKYPLSACLFIEVRVAWST
jgi:hypothetical protein